ncbi:hypothetical protein G6F56_003883 [Rhizopus delemar]|nr:hypothetical protein G6F56_003883 [Rhizopus delemar]
MGTMKQEGKKASDAIWRIGKLILTNNEFRSLLGEVIDISQDIFTHLTSQMGDSLKNAGDNLQQDQTTKRSGRDIVDSTLDQGLSPASSRKRSSHLLSSDPNDPRHLGLLNTGDSVHPHAMAADSPRRSSVPPMHSNYLGSMGQQGGDQMNAGHEEIKGQMNVGQEKAKGQMNQQKEAARQKFKEKVPDEKQDELIERLQEALAQIQQHPDYQSAIETLIGLVQAWSKRATNMSQEVQSRATDSSDRELAEKEFKALIESWAQEQSMDPLLRGVQNVMEDMKQDDELRAYYHDALRYVERLVREPGYATQDESTEEGKRLMDRGHQVLRGNYDDHLQNLTNESRRYMNLMAEDGMSRELGDRFTAIHRDLWLDSAGDPAFKPQLLNDMRISLLPALMDEIRHIPIPRIEYSDKQFDVVIENLVITGDTLLPNVFDTKIESFNSFSLKSEYSKPSSQSMMIRMSEIQADIDDVVFWYHKKSGFPKMEDRGVASMAVGGKGITIVLRVRSAVEDPRRMFKVDYCKCHVDKLKLKVNDSHHDVLYKTITPLVMGTVRRQMAKSIENSIIEKLNQLDLKITSYVNQFNQNLQNKAYESMPASEKQQTQPVQRNSLWSTLVAILNNNIKTKVANRNQKKRESSHKSTDEPVRQDNQKMKPAPIQTGKHPASPPLSPTKMTHDHSNNYKLAVDLSEATANIH